MKKRILTALLAALLLSSCGNTATETTPGEGETSADAVETVPAETEPEKLLPDLPEDDFDGYTFTIIDRGAYSSHWTSIDVYAEELTGEPINDAVYNRNAVVGEKYNFTVAEAIGASGDPTPEVKQAVQSGDEMYDLVLCAATAQGNMATQGMLVDLMPFPHLDLSQPWYDQSASEATSIAGRLFATTGELTIMDNDATWALLFNKNLAENLGIGNLYTSVSEGSWTMDALLEVITLASADLNGDGIHDETDQWGIQGEGFNTMAFIHGAGASPYAKDENDIPIITAQDERFYSAFEKAVAINGNFDLCLYADNYSGKYTDVWAEVMDASFTEGRVLFACVGMNRVTLFREMEMDFGILPIPKYDEAQEEYHCLLSLGNATMFSVPKTVTDQNRTGIILEALSAESLYTLTPAYYDVTLKTKSARDEESAAMLDLIFASRAFDLGNMYSGLAGLFNVAINLTSQGKTDLASGIEAQMKPAQSGIDKLVESIQES